MDLQDFIEEGGIQDLSWLTDGKTFTPHDTQNNVKKELIQQWNSEFDPTFKEDYERKVEEVKTSSAVLANTKALIAQGLVPLQIASELKNTFTSEEILAEKETVAEAIKADAGAIGCFIADIDHSKNINPLVNAKNKATIGYVRLVGASNIEDSTKCISMVSKAVSSQADGSLDSFFSASEEIVQSDTKFCAVTNLPIFTSRDDISEEFVDQTLVTLANDGRLSEERISMIKDKKLTPYETLQTAFISEFEDALTSKNAVYENIQMEDGYGVNDKEMEFSVVEDYEQERLPVEESIADVEVGFDMIDETMNVDIHSDYGELYEGYDEVSVQEERIIPQDLDIDDDYGQEFFI